MELGMVLMRNIWLILYYGVAWKLPMQPMPGYKLFYAIRRFLVRKLLSECGTGVVVKDRCYFGNGKNLHVGSYSQLGQNCRLQGQVVLGNHVMMGPDVVIMGITHDVSRIDIPMNTPDLPTIEKPVKVGNDVWLGTRVILMPGVEIGDHSIVGAGAVVTKSFPAYSIIAGVPAKIIGTRRSELNT